MKKNNLENNEVTDIVFLLDRSGSMSGMEDDTIGGYNGYINSMKGKNAKVTTVLFDDKYEIISERKDINRIKKMTKKIYFTRGSTSLLDAIGKTIKFMDDQKSKKVLFVITTDGYENSSKEYNKEQIKELITGHKDWEFIYIGADIDSYGEASSIGISVQRTANFTKSKKGMSKLFNKVKELSIMYEEDDCISDDWKDGLEEEK